MVKNVVLVLLCRPRGVCACGVCNSFSALNGMRRADFEAFVRDMAPLVMQNVDDAARLMLDGLNTIVIDWRGELGEHWKDVRQGRALPCGPDHLGGVQTWGRAGVGRELWPFIQTYERRSGAHYNATSTLTFDDA